MIQRFTAALGFRSATSSCGTASVKTSFISAKRTAFHSLVPKFR